ncbi:MAG: hypothetical protein IKI64_07725 [Clostridia bacterium]|nr:hypothetical protein [Clostridia bacterium]
MSRIPFSQVLKNARIDLRREYDRLYAMFAVFKNPGINGTSATIKECCESCFINMPFRGTCITLDDFDDVYDRHFEKSPRSVDMDYLVDFCEYSYNLVQYSQGFSYDGAMQLVAYGYGQPLQFYMLQVMKVIETIGYMPINQDGITIFVPKDQTAISVSEIVDPSLSYRVIEYNHHSMKGDLERKKAVLHKLADALEPQRPKLKGINSKLEDAVFFLFNNANIRHNNSDPNGGYYNSTIAAMQQDELEKLYDDTYQLCLLAFLELDNVERKTKIQRLKEEIKGK